MGGYIADIPIAFASIDPCFSCTDRMVVLQDADTGRGQQLTWPDLVKMSREG